MHLAVLEYLLIVGSSFFSTHFLIYREKIAEQCNISPVDTFAVQISCLPYLLKNKLLLSLWESPLAKAAECNHTSYSYWTWCVFSLWLSEETDCIYLHLCPKLTCSSAYNSALFTIRCPLAADTHGIWLNAWKSAHKLRKITLQYSNSTRNVGFDMQRTERLICRELSD